jgi:predicted RNase H-like HicB family nuclease
VVYEQDEDGRILALCPALQGCYAEGETEAEAAENIREAMVAHIESRLKHGEPIYAEIGVERVALAFGAPSCPALQQAKWWEWLSPTALYSTTRGVVMRFADARTADV